MITKNALLKTLAVVVTGILGSSSAMAANLGNVYETTAMLNRYIAPGNLEFGDQISLAGVQRQLTTFHFDLYTTGLSGDEHAVVRFRDHGSNPAGAPGNSIYESAPIDLVGLSEYNTITLKNLNVSVPDTFTWSVEFTGLTAGETAGLVMYGGQSIGSGLTDFWQNNGGTWFSQVIDNGNVPAHFGAAVVAVPEPSTIVLGLIGGLGLFGYMRRRSS